MPIAPVDPDYDENDPDDPANHPDLPQWAPDPYEDGPDPVLKCQTPGCGWITDAEPDDWYDRLSSSWFRAQAHADETGHVVALHLDRYEHDPFDLSDSIYRTA